VLFPQLRPYTLPANKTGLVPNGLHFTETSFLRNKDAFSKNFRNTMQISSNCILSASLAVSTLCVGVFAGKRRFDITALSDQFNRLLLAPISNEVANSVEARQRPGGVQSVDDVAV